MAKGPITPLVSGLTVIGVSAAMTGPGAGIYAPVVDAMSSWRCWVGYRI